MGDHLPLPVWRNSRRRATPCISPVCLSALGYDYAIWQGWKEGFARNFENLIRGTLGLPRNTGGASGDFSWVSFYAGGAAWIARLRLSTPQLLVDLQALFATMAQDGFADRALLVAGSDKGV